MFHMNLDQHKRLVIWLVGIGFTGIVLVLAVKESFMLDEEGIPGNTPWSNSLMLIMVIITIVGMLIALPWLQLRVHRLYARPWNSPAAISFFIMIFVGILGLGLMGYSLVVQWI